MKFLSTPYTHYKKWKYKAEQASKYNNIHSLKVLRILGAAFFTHVGCPAKILSVYESNVTQCNGNLWMKNKNLRLQLSQSTFKRKYLYNNISTNFDYDLRQLRVLFPVITIIHERKKNPTEKFTATVYAQYVKFFFSVAVIDIN